MKPRKGNIKMNNIKPLILVGNGGCMREIVWQIQMLNQQYPIWKIIGIVDKNPSEGYLSYPWLGNDEYLLSLKEEINVAICIGNPSLRKKIAEKLSQNPYLKFPTIILNQLQGNKSKIVLEEQTDLPELIIRNSIIANTASIGRGSIICMDCIVSTEVQIGEFVFLNIGSMVCHDGKIDNYVTLSPDVKLAGNVHIKQGTEIGIGAKVIQGITIGENSVIGAGAVVIRDIPPNCTAVGVPANKIIETR